MSDWSDDDQWANKMKAKKAAAKKKAVQDDDTWSDEAPKVKKSAPKSPKKPAKKVVQDDDWSDEDKPVKKPSKKKVVEDFSEEEEVKPKKSTKKPVKQAEEWSDEEEVKPKKKAVPKKVVKEESDWSDEETIKPKKKQAAPPSPKKSKQKKPPSDDDFSEDEPAPKPKKQPAKKVAANEESDWSEEEEPVKPKKKVVEAPKKPVKKAQVEPDWSDEDVPAKPAKKPVKKAVEPDWSDDEPVKPKKKPVKKQPDWSDDESDVKPVKKAPVKPKKTVEPDWSDEEEAPKPKAKPAPKKSVEPDWSDEDEPPAKPKAKTTKKVEEAFTESEDEAPKPEKAAEKPKPKKAESDDDAWGSGKDDDDDDKPKKKDSFKKKSGGFGSDDGSDDGFGGSDKGSDAERTPVTYVPDYDAAEDDDLYNATCQQGIEFDAYNDIKVNCTGYDEQDNFTGIKKWKDVKTMDPELMETIVKKMKWKSPTPIQKYSVPLLIEGRDIMGCAQTGSGKTGGFSIPVVNRILSEGLGNKDSDADSDAGSDDARGRTCCTPIALVCAPTRELVQQIQRDFVKLTKETEIKVEYVVGGHAVRSQLEKIEGAHIIVATPGRLNDFVGKGKIKLDKLKYLIVDEADRMLEMGFMEILKDLAMKMPDKDQRSTAMFSATFPDEVQKIAHSFLKDTYVFVVVGIVGAAANSVTQKFIKIDGDTNKEDTLIDLLQGVKESGEKTVIFVETKRMADFWAAKLSTMDFPATSIHGDREQREREEALRTFRSGEHPILVATNVAARGIDIPEVMHVINHDLPKDLDEYVHRIGRTGRCGNKGRATSFYKSQYDKAKADHLCKILEQAGHKVPEWLSEDCEGDGGAQATATAGGDDESDDGW